MVYKNVIKIFKMDFKGDDLSFLRKISDEEDDVEDENDLVVITLKSKVIQIHFSQLCKFSQLIREEYLISDVKNRLPHEILKFQQENKIDINNISNFFNLFKGETLTITNDRYRDFYKLSRFFKTKKLIKQLKKYFNLHVTDIDFVIQLFKEEVEQNSDENNFDLEYKSQFEQLMIYKIRDCLQNDNFQKLPTSFIYKIIEKCDENENLSDLMVDFINKSPKTLYILLRFIKLQDLSKRKFEKLFEIYSTSNKDYFQYLPCNIEYIKLLRSENENLKTDKDHLLKENSTFKNQINQLIQENDQLQNRILELEKD